MSETLRQKWESYLTEVLPADAPEIQRVECRRAFYAGAKAVQAMLLATSELDEDSAVAVLERLDGELEAFKRDCVEGMA